jgi:predicted restriction endonuclease
VEAKVTMVQVETLPTHEEAIEEPYLSKFTFLHLEDHCFHQRSRNIIPDTWILLNSQSTVSVFKNRQLLTNIRNSPSSLRMHTNGGIQKFGDVWFNPASLANILSMAEVSKVCRITMDTAVKSAMHVP